MSFLINTSTCDGLEVLINVCLLCGFLVWCPALSFYCIVMSYGMVMFYRVAIYSSVSCARLRRELESLLVLYDCLLQIIIVEFPTLSCAKFGSLTVLLLRRHVSLE